MNTPLNLKQLYPNLNIDLDLAGVQLDSRLIKPGQLFLALTGHDRDGWDFVKQALNNGAVAVLTDSERGQDAELSVPVIYLPELRQQLANIARTTWGDPSAHLRLIGVTGTNGKTSTCQFIAQLVTAMDDRAGYIGTNGQGVWGQLQHVANTTPDVLALNEQLANQVNQRVIVSAMEVSSHGLEQHRVEGLSFAAAVFTNLSQDHLDYHGTMEAYGQAKARLFTDYHPGISVINLDDEFGRKLFQQCPSDSRILTYSLSNAEADFYIKNLTHRQDGMSFWLQAPNCSREVQVPLYGDFNISNLLAAVATLYGLDYPLSSLLSHLTGLQSVDGRMEFIHQSKLAAVVIDYAHTPDALEKALTACRKHTAGDLWVVFGCGGNRDTGKRSQMGAIAERLADRVVITDDNPRNEASENILNDILSGICDTSQIETIPDREQAIRFSLTESSNEDLVLIAGKGHEDYQVVGDRIVQFSDRAVVEQVMQEAQL